MLELYWFRQFRVHMLTQSSSHLMRHDFGSFRLYFLVSASLMRLINRASEDSCVLKSIYRHFKSCQIVIYRLCSLEMCNRRNWNDPDSNRTTRAIAVKRTQRRNLMSKLQHKVSELPTQMNDLLHSTHGNIRKINFNWTLGPSIIIIAPSKHLQSSDRNEYITLAN